MVIGFSFFVFCLLLLADMLDELQEHVESIDMANGQFLSYNPFMDYLIHTLGKNIDQICGYVG